MYNHYIPQSDGSHRRSSVPDSRRPPQRPQNPPQRPEQRQEPRHNSQPEPRRDSRPEPHRDPRPEPKPEPPRCDAQPEPLPCPQPPRKDGDCEGLWSFLKGLLPREIDTADLMILFLLLLMNKDAEDSLSPMLTLALYFLL